METRTLWEELNSFLSGFFGWMSEQLASLIGDAPIAFEEVTTSDTQSLWPFTLAILLAIAFAIMVVAIALRPAMKAAEVASESHEAEPGNTPFRTPVATNVGPEWIDNGLEDDDVEVFQCTNKHCTCVYHHAEIFIDGEWDSPPCTNPDCGCGYHINEIFDEELNKWVDPVDYVV